MRIDAPDGILSMHDQLRDLGRQLAGGGTEKGKRVHVGNTSASPLKLMGKVCCIPEVEIVASVMLYHQGKRAYVVK